MSSAAFNDNTAVSASSPARKTRRYGFACAPCKTRKVKCSGEQPVCAGCRRSGVDCVWPTSTRSNESQLLHDANERIKHLEQFVGHQTSEVRSTGEAAASPGCSDLHSVSPSRTSTGRRASTRNRGSTSTGPSPPDAPIGIRAPATPGPAASTSSLWYQVGIGEDGAVIYNGPTSRFYAGSLLEDGEVEGPEDADSDEGAPSKSAALRSQYSLMDSVWTPLIAAKPTMNGTGVDTKTGITLLDIYWTWLHPLHHLVYRPVFLMDLALGGPHCSDFLLLCIFALAARHLPPDHAHGPGEEYVERAKNLLLDQMAAPTPTIATIQGLLILGGRECAIGRSSQGWLYTGMAIRMMQDVGLHLDTTGLVGLAERRTPAEIEVRKRLYNAAYLWDKTLSLALGRPPSLVSRPYPDVLDKFDDQRLWRPIHATEVAQSFVPSPSWATSTLCVSCRLHEITTDMLLLFSRSPSAGNFTEQIRELDRRFVLWYDESPDHLKISDPSQLKHSPPPHIVSLNLLYHTLHILLRRPLLGGSDDRLHDEHIGHCIDHAKKIHAIHTLYAQTFPHRLMTYQVSYCIYTAATVEALELKRATNSPAERGEAAARLTSAVRILQNEASHSPGSGKSLDTIRRLLSESQRRQQPRKRRRSDQAARSPPLQDVGITQEPLPPLDTDPTADLNPTSWAQPIVDFGFYGGIDTGAGFHPDSFPWGFSDDFPRMPMPPRVPTDPSYPLWGSQPWPRT